MKKITGKMLTQELTQMRQLRHYSGVHVCAFALQEYKYTVNLLETDAAVATWRRRSGTGRAYPMPQPDDASVLLSCYFAVGPQPCVISCMA
jgi:hypothetical protein